jgi:hypothetical protein
LEKEQLQRPVDRFVKFIETTTCAGSLYAMPDLGEPFTDEELSLTDTPENDLP